MTAHLFRSVPFLGRYTRGIWMPRSLMIFMDVSFNVMARSKATKQSQLIWRLLHRENHLPRNDGKSLCRLHVLGKFNQLCGHFRTDACLGFFRPCTDVG